MATSKKPDEKKQLAKARLFDDEQPSPEVTLESCPRTLTEGEGSVALTVKVKNVPSDSNSIRCELKVDSGTVSTGSGANSPCGITVFDIDVRENEGDGYREAIGTVPWHINNVPVGSHNASVRVPELGLEKTASVNIVPRRVQASVTLQRSAAGPTDDQALWVAIRNRTDAISFARYNEFINRLLCPTETCNTTYFTDRGQATCDPCSEPRERNYPRVQDYGAPSVGEIRGNLGLRPNIYGPDAYYLLKMAAQAFLIFESGVVIEHQRDPDSGDMPNSGPVPGLEDSENRLGRPVSFSEIKNILSSYLGIDGKLPYLERIVNALIPAIDARDEGLPFCGELLQHRFSCPSLFELIWSYWEEEGMLVQTMNAIAWRFQNRSHGAHDPLANLELDPLRPLNNLLWGFIQDEHNRLTVARRAYEYDHHYGLNLVGKAVPKLASADSRSKFITAFHYLLNRAAIFFKADSDTTVIADAFPLLNALKEVHLLLAEGAHNQFGDLPWTARAEMLNMQWFLSRTEIREFLRGRHMVPYQEPWMGAVDDMKRLQGWTDTSVTHFHELAVTGERILLSVRYGDWTDLNNTEEQAKNWARHWKPEIQVYNHAYQAATGVDLSAEITDTQRVAERYLQPSAHLQRRLEAQPSWGGRPTRGTGRVSPALEILEYPEMQGFRQRRLTRLQGR